MEEQQSNLEQDGEEDDISRRIVSRQSNCDQKGMELVNSKTVAVNEEKSIQTVGDEDVTAKEEQEDSEEEAEDKKRDKRKEKRREKKKSKSKSKSKVKRSGEQRTRKSKNREQDSDKEDEPLKEKTKGRSRRRKEK